MTAATTATTATTAIPDELMASVQHLGLINDSIGSAEAKLTRLKGVRGQTLEQIAFAVRRVSVDRNWDRVDLLAVYEEISCPGLHTAWTAAWPTSPPGHAGGGRQGRAIRSERPGIRRLAR